MPTEVRFVVQIRKRNGDVATASSNDFTWLPSTAAGGVFRAQVNDATGPVTVSAVLTRKPDVKGVADIQVIEHPGATELTILSVEGRKAR